MYEYEEELTVEQLKKYEGFENITDEEAAQIIMQIKEFCLIVVANIQGTNEEE